MFSPQNTPKQFGSPQHSPKSPSWRAGVEPPRKMGERNDDRERRRRERKRKERRQRLREGRRVGEKGQKERRK